MIGGEGDGDQRVGDEEVVDFIYIYIYIYFPPLCSLFILHMSVEIQL
jgi:hypothetical protein